VLTAGADADELCYTKPSAEFEPFKSEHEGYMANYGNTVDRWYHRAAVVLWPRERPFVIRAKTSPMWQSARLPRRSGGRRRDGFGLGPPRVLPFWAQAVRLEGTRTSPIEPCKCPSNWRTLRSLPHCSISSR